MKNYINKGERMTFTAPAGGVVSGVPVLIGSLLVVPIATVAAGSKFAGQTVGYVSYTKTGTQAWTEGQKIYWDNTNKVFTNVVGSNILVGVAGEAVGAGAGETLGKVRLDGVAR